MQARRATRLAVWSWTRSRLVFASCRNSTGNRAALAALHAVDDFNTRNDVFVHVRCLLSGPIHTAHVMRGNARQRPLTRVAVLIKRRHTCIAPLHSHCARCRALPDVVQRKSRQVWFERHFNAVITHHDARWRVATRVYVHCCSSSSQLSGWK